MRTRWPILSAMINAMSCYEPEMMEIEDETTLERAAARIISKVRTVAAASYKMSIGQPLMYRIPNSVIATISCT